MPTPQSQGVAHKTPVLWKHALLLAIGIAIFLLGWVLKLTHSQEFFWQLVQSSGVTIFSVSLTLVTYTFFGGSPEIQEATASLHDLNLGQQTRVVGITKIYNNRLSANSDMLDDVRNSKTSCRMYAAVYLSQFIKDESLNIAIQEAASHAHARRKKYGVSYCSFDPSTSEPNNSLLQIWAARENELDNSRVIMRIKRGSDFIDRLKKSVETKLGRNCVTFTRRFFKNYFPPHSLLIIDDTIVYVSFYTWCHISGDDAPTLRLESGPWHKVFLEEARKIDEQFSFEFESSPTE